MFVILRIKLSFLLLFSKKHSGFFKVFFYLFVLLYNRRNSALVLWVQITKVKEVLEMAIIYWRYQTGIYALIVNFHSANRNDAFYHTRIEYTKLKKI